MKRYIFYLICSLLININSFSLISYYPTPNSFIVSASDIAFFPESERPLNFVILGNDSKNFISLKNNSFLHNAHFNEVEENLWMLSFELAHGRIINALPDYTKIYFAITDDKEKKFFTNYLIKKCGFNKNEIKNRVYFFKCESPVLWTQDAGEIIGRNSNGKIILLSDNDTYSFSLNNIFKFFPDVFNLHKSSELLSIEGGDVEIVWDVNRKGVIALIGRHRVYEYFYRKENIDYKNIAVSPDKINEVKNAYKNLFYNINVEIIPEKILMQPSIATNELFHLDMVATVLANGEKVYAFVPYYEKITGNVDIVLKNVLDSNFVKKLQIEYDEIANQLKEIGYYVVRLPIYDHPVRSPTNIVKFINKKTDKPTVLLGKYPYYNPTIPKEESPFAKIEDAIYNIDSAVKLFEKNPDDKNYNDALTAINLLWKIFNEEYSSKNPYFEKQKKTFTDCGFDVIEVPTCASGSGGLHCTTLY